jgi:hypothetical protein
MGESTKYQTAAVVFALLFALAALYAWQQHERVTMLCKWTGVHREVRAEDAETARDGVDSICSGMADVVE